MTDTQNMGTVKEEAPAKEAVLRLNEMEYAVVSAAVLMLLGRLQPAVFFDPAEVPTEEDLPEMALASVDYLMKTQLLPGIGSFAKTFRLNEARALRQKFGDAGEQAWPMEGADVQAELTEAMGAIGVNVKFPDRTAS